MLYFCLPLPSSQNASVSLLAVSQRNPFQMPPEMVFMVPGKEQVRTREDMKGQGTPPREAYQSRHGSGHMCRIPSLIQTELAFVQQIHAGIQDEFLILFWGENGDILICCSKPEFACDIEFPRLWAFSKLFSPNKG